jgi:glycosyltransferase involved in cell wall biosynthesis
VDNFIDMWPDSMVGRSRKRFLGDAMLRADSLTAISHTLCDRVEELIGRRPSYVPNGAALEEMRAWPAARVARIRERHSLQGKTVLAFIGNHNLHNHGTEMLLDAFLQARKARRSLELLLIGPGADRFPRSNGSSAEGVHVVGPVPTAEISDYFHAADLGLLPFRLDAATHHSLPIKVLEFGAAGKPMISSPLDELKRLGLPHVRFVEFSPASWRDAILDDRSYERPDHALLEASLRPFGWDQIADGLVRTMGLS